WHLDAEVLRVVSRPARRGDFYDPHIVESPERRIKVGVGPDFDQLWSADRVRVARVRDVHRVSDRRQLAIGGRPAIAAPDDVVDLLRGLAAFADPALDDL